MSPANTNEHRWILENDCRLLQVTPVVAPIIISMLVAMSLVQQLQYSATDLEMGYFLSQLRKKARHSLHSCEIDNHTFTAEARVF